jgi:hypothetical protein
VRTRSTRSRDALSARVDRDPEAYRWSYARDLCGSRLVVVDSRAARVLTPERRSILDDAEMAWLTDQLRGGYRHLLIGTSLPFLLSPGLHHVEAWNEALASRSGHGWRARFGEWLRQAVDLEHWAAFQTGFRAVAELVVDVADGRRGAAPATVTFLSGDVHHSYVSEARPADGRRLQSRILQVVCSPIRNPLPRGIRFATGFLSYGIAGPVGMLAARAVKVPEAPLRWKLARGPWYDNTIATAVAGEDSLEIWWETGEVSEADHAHPAMRRISGVTCARARV